MPNVGETVVLHQNNTPLAVGVVTAVNEDGTVNVSVLTATNNSVPVGKPDSTPDNPDPIYVDAGDKTESEAANSSSGSTNL